MLIASLLAHGCFCLVTLFADETDAVPLPLRRGSVSIRLVARRPPVAETQPPAPELETPLSVPETESQPLPPESETPPIPERQSPEHRPLEAAVAPLAVMPLTSPSVPDRRPTEPTNPQQTPPENLERVARALPDIVRTKIDIEADADLTVLRPEGTDVEQHARARFNPLPPHPVTSRGSVLLLVRVGINGKPEWARVRQSSGQARADELAREFVARVWQFEPARRRGETVPQEVEVLVNFQ